MECRNPVPNNNAKNRPARAGSSIEMASSAMKYGWRAGNAEAEARSVLAIQIRPRYRRMRDRSAANARSSRPAWREAAENMPEGYFLTDPQAFELTSSDLGRLFKCSLSQRSGGRKPTWSDPSDRVSVRCRRLIESPLLQPTHQWQVRYQPAPRREGGRRFGRFERLW